MYLSYRSVANNILIDGGHTIVYVTKLAVIMLLSCCKCNGAILYYRNYLFMACQSTQFTCQNLDTSGKYFFAIQQKIELVEQ